MPESDVRNVGHLVLELRRCVKVEVAVLGSPSLIVLMVSVDVKQHCTRGQDRGQELSECRGALLGLPFIIVRMISVDVKQPCESRGGRPGLPVHNSPYGLCGRKATVNKP